MPLPGHSLFGSISAKNNFVLVCLHPPRSSTREVVCRSSGQFQTRCLPGVHPEYSTTASGRGSKEKETEAAKIKLGMDGHHILEDNIGQAIRNNRKPNMQGLAKNFNVHQSTVE
ncbi:hypothetical protein TNCV_729031 [Trichonephila clavipes]|nr:hypothetical protein TNCV_729031 [Trichonephila clavipes]